VTAAAATGKTDFRGRGETSGRSPGRSCGSTSDCSREERAALLPIRRRCVARHNNRPEKIRHFNFRRYVDTIDLLIMYFRFFACTL
jgi:hypothetical protein